MTLGENKKIALSLIEEYSPNNEMLTDDEDIATRLNFIYATNYQELSQEKKILKTKVLREITGRVSDGYEEISLPSNMYQLKKINALDDKNNNLISDFKIIGKKIYISNKVDAKWILEYYIYPTIINDETDDDFILEIDQDAQMILPYAVANDILKSDPSSDYTAFYGEYKRKLEGLNQNILAPTVSIKEGIL